MKNKALIECFRNTVDVSCEEPIRSYTKKSFASSRVYKEYFISRNRRSSVGANIVVVEGSSFAKAKEYVGEGKIAVLNFANPVIPGGGVENGSRVQEESLCRSSNLFLCLRTDNMAEDFYEYNRNSHSDFYSDRLIYTKDVLVFKDDGPIPQLMEPRDWFQVDVISCAAPYIAKRKYIN